MREIKHRLYIDISVESSDKEEFSPYPKFLDKEQVQLDTKKVKLRLMLMKNSKDMIQQIRILW
jgi:hypothetical protein